MDAWSEYYLTPQPIMPAGSTSNAVQYSDPTEGDLTSVPCDTYLGGPACDEEYDFPRDDPRCAPEYENVDMEGVAHDSPLYDVANSGETC